MKYLQGKLNCRVSLIKQFICKFEIIRYLKFFKRFYWVLWKRRHSALLIWQPDGNKHREQSTDGLPLSWESLYQLKYRVYCKVCHILYHLHLQCLQYCQMYWELAGRQRVSSRCCCCGQEFLNLVRNQWLIIEQNCCHYNKITAIIYRLCLWRYKCWAQNGKWFRVKSLLSVYWEEFSKVNSKIFELKTQNWF